MEGHQEHRNVPSLLAPRLGKAAQTWLSPARLPTALTACSSPRLQPNSIVLWLGWACRDLSPGHAGLLLFPRKSRDFASSHAELDIGAVQPSAKHKLGLPKSHMSGLGRTCQPTHHGNCHSLPPGHQSHSSCTGPRAPWAISCQPRTQAPLSHCSPSRSAERLEPNNHQEFTPDIAASLQPQCSNGHCGLFCREQ